MCRGSSNNSSEYHICCSIFVGSAILVLQNFKKESYLGLHSLQMLHGKQKEFRSTVIFLFGASLFTVVYTPIPLQPSASLTRDGHHGGALRDWWNFYSDFYSCLNWPLSRVLCVLGLGFVSQAQLSIVCANWQNSMSIYLHSQFQHIIGQ